MREVEAKTTTTGKSEVNTPRAYFVAVATNYDFYCVQTILASLV